MRPTRRHRTLLAGTSAALLLLLAAPAGAHPFFRDAEVVPAASLTTLTLAMAHGCGSEAEGRGEPTTEVAVEVHERFLFVEPHDQDGFDVTVETADDGRPAVLLWSATTSTEPAPEVVFDVVVDGQAGDEVYVKVFQGCGDEVYRWIGTPDEPAEDPAVRLVLTAPDPDAPPPPQETITPPPPEDPPADPDADDPPDEADGDQPDDPADDGATSVAEEAETTGLPWAALVVVVLVVVVLGAVLASRSRGNGPGDGPPGDPPVDPTAT